MNVTSYYKGYHIDADPATTGKDDIKAAKDFCELLIAEGLMPSWNPETTKQALAPETPPMESPTTPSKFFCPECGAAMTYRESKPGAPKRWKGYFCPNNKDHKPQWV